MVFNPFSLFLSPLLPSSIFIFLLSLLFSFLFLKLEAFQLKDLLKGTLTQAIDNSWIFCWKHWRVLTASPLTLDMASQSTAVGPKGGLLKASNHPG